MEPAFYRGDLLFLTNPVNEPYLVGDITVYKVRTSFDKLPIGIHAFGLDPWRRHSNRPSSDRKPL